MNCAGITDSVCRHPAARRAYAHPEPHGRILFHLDGTTDQPHEFSINQFGLDPATFHPRGDRYLRRFEIGETARWTFEVDGVRVVKELLLCWQKNVAAVRYTLEAGSERKLGLELLPFTGLRDFHALRRGGPNMGVERRRTPGSGR